MTRRGWLRSALLLSLLLSSLVPPARLWGGAARADGQERPLRLSGPPVAESLPLLALATGRAWPGLPHGARFIPWHTPDQLRALVAGGQVDAVLLTTASAATLRNKGLACVVIQLISSPGWIISIDPELRFLHELSGQEVLLPFGPGEMPEMLLGVLCQEAGVRVRTWNVGGPMEAVNLVLLGKGRHAFLSEPAVSLALARSARLAAKGAPPLYKAIDMRTAWRRAFGGDPAHGCLAVVGPASRSGHIRDGLRTAFGAAHAWARRHQALVLEAAGETFPALAGLAASGAVDLGPVRLISGPHARRWAWDFLQRLHARSPATVGGRMPPPALLDLQP